MRTKNVVTYTAEELMLLELMMLTGALYGIDESVVMIFECVMRERDLVSLYCWKRSNNNNTNTGA